MRVPRIIGNRSSAPGDNSGSGGTEAAIPTSVAIPRPRSAGSRRTANAPLFADVCTRTRLPLRPLRRVMTRRLSTISSCAIDRTDRGGETERTSVALMWNGKRDGDSWFCDNYSRFDVFSRVLHDARLVCHYEILVDIFATTALREKCV